MNSSAKDGGLRASPSLSVDTQSGLKSGPLRPRGTAGLAEPPRPPSPPRLYASAPRNTSPPAEVAGYAHNAARLSIRVSARHSMPHGARSRSAQAHSATASYFAPRRRAEVLGCASSVCVFEWTKWRRSPRLTKVSFCPASAPSPVPARLDAAFRAPALPGGFSPRGPGRARASAVQAAAPRNGVLLRRRDRRFVPCGRRRFSLASRGPALALSGSWRRRVWAGVGRRGGFALAATGVSRPGPGSARSRVGEIRPGPAWPSRVLGPAAWGEWGVRSACFLPRSPSVPCWAFGWRLIVGGAGGRGRGTLVLSVTEAFRILERLKRIKVEKC